MAVLYLPKKSSYRLILELSLALAFGRFLLTLPGACSSGGVLESTFSRNCASFVFRAKEDRVCEPNKGCLFASQILFLVLFALLAAVAWSILSHKPRVTKAKDDGRELRLEDVVIQVRGIVYVNLDKLSMFREEFDLAVYERFDSGEYGGILAFRPASEEEKRKSAAWSKRWSSMKASLDPSDLRDASTTITKQVREQLPSIQSPSTASVSRIFAISRRVVYITLLTPILGIHISQLYQSISNNMWASNSAFKHTTIMLSNIGIDASVIFSDITASLMFAGDLLIAWNLVRTICQNSRAMFCNGEVVDRSRLPEPQKLQKPVTAGDI